MSKVLIIATMMIPALLIVWVVYIMMRHFLKQNLRQMEFLNKEQELLRLRLEIDRKNQSDKAGLAMRFQAYERLALFLERINPVNLIPRVMAAGRTAGWLQASLLKTIRDEYEHNLSQQLYISDASWLLVKKAKEEVASLVNLVASKVKSDDEAAKFAGEMLTLGFAAKENPIEKALSSLKDEVRKEF